MRIPLGAPVLCRSSRRRSPRSSRCRRPGCRGRVSASLPRRTVVRERRGERVDLAVGLRRRHDVEHDRSARREVDLARVRHTRQQERRRDGVGTRAPGRRRSDRSGDDRRERDADEELTQQHHDPRARVASRRAPRAHLGPARERRRLPRRARGRRAARRRGRRLPRRRRAGRRGTRADARPSRGARLRDGARQRGRVPARDSRRLAGAGHRAAARGARLDAVAARAPRSSSRSARSRRSCAARSKACRLLLFHGSPRSYDDVLLPELGGEALEPFLGHDAALLAGGHTHLQWTRRIGDALYVNPGSVGLSYDRHADPPVLRPLARVGARHRRGRSGRGRVPPGAVRGRGRPGSGEAKRPAVRGRVGRAVGLSGGRAAREVDDGWDFKVLILEDEWVVRWPRHKLAVEEIEQEVELLPELAPLLSVEVPRLEYVSRDPWLVAYRLIRGEPLVDEDSAGVRAFLDELHAIEVNAVPAPRPDWLATYLRAGRAVPPGGATSARTRRAAGGRGSRSKRSRR